CTIMGRSRFDSGLDNYSIVAFGCYFYSISQGVKAC
ncbi:hypothetical protein, partial [uncultured Gammaproteobacteria bacterium]